MVKSHAFLTGKYIPNVMSIMFTRILKPMISVSMLYILSSKTHQKHLMGSIVNINIHDFLSGSRQVVQIEAALYHKLHCLVVSLTGRNLSCIDKCIVIVMTLGRDLQWGIYATLDIKDFQLVCILELFSVLTVIPLCSKRFRLIFTTSFGYSYMYF